MNRIVSLSRIMTVAFIRLIRYMGSLLIVGSREEGNRG